MFRRALSLGMNAWKDPKKKIKECHSKINIIFTTCYVLQMESPMDEKFTVMIASDCKKLQLLYNAVTIMLEFYVTRWAHVIG